MNLLKRPETQYACPTMLSPYTCAHVSWKNDLIRVQVCALVSEKCEQRHVAPWPLVHAHMNNKFAPSISITLVIDDGSRSSLLRTLGTSLPLSDYTNQAWKQPTKRKNSPSTQQPWQPKKRQPALYK